MTNKLPPYDMYRSGVRPRRISSPLTQPSTTPQPPVNSPSRSPLYVPCAMCHPIPLKSTAKEPPALIGYAALLLMSPTPFATCLFGMHHRTSCTVSSLALKTVSRHWPVGEPPSSILPMPRR